MKQLIYILLLAAFAAWGVYQVIQASQSEVAYLQRIEQPTLSPLVGVYIADIMWVRGQCDTSVLGNFAPLVHCDTLIVIQPHAIIKTNTEPKPQVWTEQLEPPAQGMKVAKIVRWISRPKSGK
jgi:hypothetical protein